MSFWVRFQDNEIYPYIVVFPVQVEYSVTEHGKTLFPILDAMCEWGYHNTDGRYVMTHPTCEDE